MNRPPRLAGKRILVTAAAAGIGRAIAEAASAEGAQVLATDIDEAGLADLGPDIETAKLDACDADAVAKLMRSKPVWDGLANCVGYVHHGSILDCSPEQWRRSFTINVDSIYHLMRAVLPGMLERGAGSIVNIASAASSLKGFPNRAAYGATKAAVIGLTKAVAVDCVAKGVRVNAICPGTVDSPSLRARMEALGKDMGSYEAARNSFIARQPMGRLGRPEEIAATAVHLLSDETAFITGQTIIIDGGILA